MGWWKMREWTKENNLLLSLYFTLLISFCPSSSLSHFLSLSPLSLIPPTKLFKFSLFSTSPPLRSGPSLPSSSHEPRKVTEFVPINYRRNLQPLRSLSLQASTSLLPQSSFSRTENMRINLMDLRLVRTIIFTLILPCAIHCNLPSSSSSRQSSSSTQSPNQDPSLLSGM